MKIWIIVLWEHVERERPRYEIFQINSVVKILFIIVLRERVEREAMCVHVMAVST